MTEISLTFSVLFMDQKRWLTQLSLCSQNKDSALLTVVYLSKKFKPMLFYAKDSKIAENRYSWDNCFIQNIAFYRNRPNCNQIHTLYYTCYPSWRSISCPLGFPIEICPGKSSSAVSSCYCFVGSDCHYWLLSKQVVADWLKQVYWKM